MLVVGLNFDLVKQRLHLLAFIPIGWCGAGTQRHARLLNNQVDQDSFAFVSVCYAFTPTLSRGKKSHQWLQNPNESDPHFAQALVPGPPVVGGFH